MCIQIYIYIYIYIYIHTYIHIYIYIYIYIYTHTCIYRSGLPKLGERTFRPRPFARYAALINDLYIYIYIHYIYIYICMCIYIYIYIYICTYLYIYIYMHGWHCSEDPASGKPGPSQAPRLCRMGNRHQHVDFNLDKWGRIAIWPWKGTFEGKMSHSSGTRVPPFEIHRCFEYMISDPMSAKSI